MGRLIEVDEVLGLNCLSKRAIQKIIELPSKPAISYRAKTIWNDMSRDDTECHCLASALIYAFRYAVGRHGTECMIRDDLDKIILANLNLMPTEFINQMIHDIEMEFETYKIKVELGTKVAGYAMDPHYLDSFYKALKNEYNERRRMKV